jgi:hypothetical protein
MSLEWVSGSIVTCDLMIVWPTGTLLAQSPLHAFLHFINSKFLTMKIADGAEMLKLALSLAGQIRPTLSLSLCTFSGPQCDSYQV